MDLRNEQDEAKRETPAVTWTRAPEVDQTAKTSGHELTERLQQCQRDRQEVNLMLHTVTQDQRVRPAVCVDPRCSVCPDGWLWWGGHCYFFSVGQQDDRSWIESSEFCLQLNSSLAVIRDPAEMEFIQGVMSRFPLFPFLWVGLTDAQQEGLWLWGDGGDVQQYMPVTVEWDAEDRDCADLRGGGSLFASSCEAYGPWACKRGS
nr:PREDICTED: C-type lectin domain family 12 member B-like [Notothenia coriiceps]